MKTRNFNSHIQLSEVEFIFNDNSIAKKYLECLNTPCNSEYFEYHHIIPKCFSHNDSDENVVKVSLETHFKCHYYLTFSCIPELKKKMCFAFRQMMSTRLLNFDLELYAKRFQELISEKMFSSNYVRTDDIKTKVSNSVSKYAQESKPIWINNGVSEKYVPYIDAQVLLKDGFVRGRILKPSKEQVSINSKKVHQQKMNGTYTPTKKALRKRELRKAEFEKALCDNNLKIFRVSLDGVDYVKMSTQEILNSGLNYLTSVFFL